MTDNEITGDIVDAAVKIHKALGPGMLEHAYHRVLAVELRQRGHVVEEQVPIGIVWRDEAIRGAFVLDLIVDGRVVVELKASRTHHPVHSRQVLTYLQWSGLRVGLLLNFGMHRMRTGVRRFVWDPRFRPEQCPSEPVPARRSDESNL